MVAKLQHWKGIVYQQQFDKKMAEISDFLPWHHLGNKKWAGIGGSEDDMKAKCKYLNLPSMKK